MRKLKLKDSFILFGNNNKTNNKYSDCSEGKGDEGTMKKNTLRAEQQKQYIIEQFWLLYYNQVLFEHGLITEQERNRMANRINNRKISSG